MHADAGSWVVHAHCLRNRETGEMVVLGVIPPPGRSERLRRREMVRMVRDVASAAGDDVVPITEADVNEAMTDAIAAKLLEQPNLNIVIVPWSIAIPA